MKKPQIALFTGILLISIFPVLVKIALTSAMVSAFYRMAIPAAILLPYMLISKKLKFPNKNLVLRTVGCGIMFASDLALWNVSIQMSSATQATLLTNLAPIWVGIIAFLFLPTKPKSAFWIGTALAMIGVVIFIGTDIISTLSFDTAFIFGTLSGIFYAFYILLSKDVLDKVEVLPFVTVSFTSSAVFIGIINLFIGEPFVGFTFDGWTVLLIQGILCQLVAWQLISYATKKMRATRVSLSLLAQGVFAAIIAWAFIGEYLSLENVIGGTLILAGIAVTFYEPKQKINSIRFKIPEKIKALRQGIRA